MKSRTSLVGRAALQEVGAIDLRVLQALFDLTPDMAFFVKNANGEYVAVNDSLLSRHGLKQKSEAIGKRPVDICAGDFGRIPTEQDNRVLRTGKPLVDCLEMQWHRPGEPVWCLTSKLPLRDAQGKITGLIGFSRDVRARVEASEIPKELAIALADFEQDLASDFSPALLALRTKMSATRLARLTKKLFSLTPSQLITKLRITAATRLLRESQVTVAEIAQRCGYSDQSAFTRAFRTITGLPPLEYRKRERDLRMNVTGVD